MGLESPTRGRAWARDFEDITRWAGRRLGQAPSARPGSTPPPRVGPPGKIVGFEILDFLEFENMTKRDIKRDILRSISYFRYAQMSRIVTFFSSLGTAVIVV